MGKLEDRVYEVYCNTHQGVDEETKAEVKDDPYTALWSIEQGLLGTQEACEDWQKYFKAIQKKFNISDQEAMQVWSEVWEEVGN